MVNKAPGVRLCNFGEMEAVIGRGGGCHGARTRLVVSGFARGDLDIRLAVFDTVMTTTALFGFAWEGL